VVENRTFKFEVMQCVEGRWQLVSVGNDKETAIADARKLLSTGGKATQARVIQQRFMPNGPMSESIVFDEKAAPVADKPIAVKNAPDDVAICETLDEMYGAPSRRTIGAVLREYCTKQNITPTELLHHYAHQRKLQDLGGLLPSAIHRVGSAQAQKLAKPAKERLNHLDRMADQIVARSRDFQTERKKLPSFDGEDFGALSERVRAAIGDEQHDFTVLATLCMYLFEKGTLSGKLEALLELKGTDRPAVAKLVDGVVADILGFNDIIQDLFGAQRNLATFLTELAGLLANRPTTVELCKNATLRAIILRIHAGVAPQCQEALLDRLLRELASDKPLDKLDPQSDGRLLDRLVEHLKDDQEQWIGGERTEAAITYRRAVQRQKFLRDSGLGSIADTMRMPKRL
jgi:hypothetical protein